MAHSVIDKELIRYIDLLNLTQKKSLLSVIKSFLQPGEQKSISIEMYNQEIADAEAEIERGESFTHDEVIKISENWTRDK
jgi:predicted transcriptional regulator